MSFCCLGLKAVCGVVDHRRFIGAHHWERPALPQRVNHGVAHPGPAGGGRMRVPDIGAVHRPRRGDDGQFLDFLREGGLVPQVMGQMVTAAGHLRAVDGNRPRPGTDHAAAFSGQLVERLAELCRDLITRDYG